MRRQRSRLPGTAISLPHISGASLQPISRAALAGKSAFEVGGGSEERCRDVLGMNVVRGDHLLEELAAGGQDVVRSIAIYGDSASDTSAEHAATSSRTRRPFPLREPCVKQAKQAGQEGIRAATTAARGFPPRRYRRSL